jgi:hypothetical protein
VRVVAVPWVGTCGSSGSHLSFGCALYRCGGTLLDRWASLGIQRGNGSTPARWQLLVLAPGRCSAGPRSAGASTTGSSSSPPEAVWLYTAVSSVELSDDGQGALGAGRVTQRPNGVPAARSGRTTPV